MICKQYEDNEYRFPTAMLTEQFLIECYIGSPRIYQTFQSFYKFSQFTIITNTWPCSYSMQFNKMTFTYIIFCMTISTIACMREKNSHLAEQNEMKINECMQRIWFI